MQTWVGAIRALDYALQGIAAGLLLWTLVRNIAGGVIAATPEGRAVFLLAAMVDILLLWSIAGGFVALTERVDQGLPFNWRDWFVAVQYGGIIVFALLARRMQPSWNPHEDRS